MLEALKDSVDSVQPQNRDANESLQRYTASVNKCYEQLRTRHDEQHGGFSQAPKFPTCVNLTFLFALHRFLEVQRASASNDAAQKQSETALQMALKQLACMSGGGVNDQVGGGFHRYSTDARWHVPHFEKMLYDQAQLVTAYVDAFTLSRSRTDLAFEVRRVLQYLQRELLWQDAEKHECAFYSAEDADSLPPSR